MLLVADNAQTGCASGAVKLGQSSDASVMNPSAHQPEETKPETTDFMARIQQVLDDLRHNPGGEAPHPEAPAPWGEISRSGVEESRPLEGWGNTEQAGGDEAIEGLRRQVDELQQKLADSEGHRAMLEQQLAEAGGNRIQDSTQGELEEKLRVERLEIERERAELDRQRTKLEYERRGLDRARDCDEINERVQVLRQHLQEIHQRQQGQRQVGSLSKWITRLWEGSQRRMRSRPQAATAGSLETD